MHPAEAAARQLLAEVLQCPVGAARASLLVSAANAQAIQHAEFRKWMVEQRIVHAAAAAYAGETQAADRERLAEMEEEELFDTLEGVQQQLAQAAEERFKSSLLVTRLRRSALVTRAVFGKEGDELPDGITHADLALIQERVRQRDGLDEKYGQLRKQADALRREVEHIKEDIQSLRRRNREEVEALQQASQTAQAPKSPLKDPVQSELARNAIIRNVFQLIVVASGVDWSADPELCDAMLSCEAPPI